MLAPQQPAGCPHLRPTSIAPATQHERLGDAAINGANATHRHNAALHAIFTAFKSLTTAAQATTGLSLGDRGDGAAAGKAEARLRYSHINAGHVPDFIRWLAKPHCYEVKCYTPFHATHTLGNGSDRCGGAASTADGGRFALGNTEELLIVQNTGVAARGGPDDPPLNRCTGVGRVEDCVSVWVWPCVARGPRGRGVEENHINYPVNYPLDHIKNRREAEALIRVALAQATGRSMLRHLWLVVVLNGAGIADACVSGTCSQHMCSDIPSDNGYYLTSFCDPSVSCGSWSGDCNEYFCADYKRFGCHAIISCCQNSDCLNLKVIDGGPNCDVEDSAGKQVVDASYSACEHFTGSKSCGWSDRVSVKCHKTGYTVDDTNDPASKSYALGRIAPVPLGPCSYNVTFAKAKGRPTCIPLPKPELETTLA